ncbi:LysM peptidoglycan-binding domain-containing protein, partial [Streptomyces shenzhenensis]|uniref:LysM peptidoglycan-binding domain-containing protein n=1 Tax=Streptomyces shenzhenensis TaxID=943815 RepID=UPI0015F11BD0
TKSTTEPATKSSTTPAARKSAPAAKAPRRSTAGTSSTGHYTVREGDTLSQIAERHGTTWQRLYAANEAVIGDDPNLIVPGQRLAL